MRNERKKMNEMLMNYLRVNEGRISFRLISPDSPALRREFNGAYYRGDENPEKLYLVLKAPCRPEYMGKTGSPGWDGKGRYIYVPSDKIAGDLSGKKHGFKYIGSSRARPDKRWN